jgi:hypothetical protein
MAPYEAALRSALAHIEPAAVPRVVTAVGRVRAYRATAGVTGDVTSDAAGGAATGKGGGAAAAGLARRPLLHREWGADLGFVAPDAPAAGGAAGLEGYLDRLCGGRGGGGGSGGGAAVAAAAATAALAPGLPGATPGELLELYAAGMGGARPAAEAAAALGEVPGDAALAARLAAEEGGGGYGGGYGAAAGGFAGGVDEDVEIDSDDERKKGRKVGTGGFGGFRRGRARAPSLRTEVGVAPGCARAPFAPKLRTRPAPALPHPQAGVLWLERWAKGVAGPEEVDNLGTAVASLLLSEAAGGSEDALAAGVMDLLGDAGFEAAQELMERRWGGAGVAGGQDRGRGWVGRGQGPGGLWDGEDSGAAQ